MSAAYQPASVLPSKLEKACSPAASVGISPGDRVLLAVLRRPALVTYRPSQICVECPWESLWALILALGQGGLLSEVTEVPGDRINFMLHFRTLPLSLLKWHC